MLLLCYISKDLASRNSACITVYPLYNDKKLVYYYVFFFIVSFVLLALLATFHVLCL